ncbi:Uncharacterised protein [Neisseria meningitidis]|nr:Uncharacterised protein [Neisseria meningitidis]
MVACPCEFVCQRVADKRACRRADQALQQPASCRLVVNILLPVFTGNGLPVVAVCLCFGRNGVFDCFGSQLVNRIVCLLCELLLQGFNLFLLLFEPRLRVVLAGGGGECCDKRGGDDFFHVCPVWVENRFYCIAVGNFGKHSAGKS